MKQSVQSVGLSLAGVVLLVLAWQLGASLLAQRVALANLLAPLPTFQSLIDLLVSGQLNGHIVASLRRVVVGLFWALLFGVPLGLLLGQSRVVAQMTGTAFQFLRMVSPLSWMPVVVMLLGIGDVPIYFLLAFSAVWPILLNTATGVKAIRPQWRQLGYALVATRREMLLRIMLPAVLGHILTGLRLAIGVVWIVLVPCEMIGVNEGLGYFILDTRDRLAYSELMAVIVLIGALGWLLDGVTRRLHERFAAHG